MKNLLAGAVLAAAAALSASAQDETTEDDARARLNAVIEEARLAMSEPEPGRYAGPGWDWLSAQAAEAHVFLIGEDHGLADAPQVMAAMMPALREADYGAYVLEISPRMAGHVERLARADQLDAMLADPRRAIETAFLGQSEDAALAARVAREWGDDGPALWGVDQEFVASGVFLMGELSALARTDAQRALVDGYAADAAEGGVNWFAMQPEEMFDRLEAAYAAPEDEAARALIEDMRASWRIYGPFTRGGGSIYRANAEREDLMRANYLRFREARAEAPRVMARLGTYHTQYGPTGTNVIGFGTTMRELARLEGGSSFSIIMLCGPGGIAGNITGNAAPCDDGFDDGGRLSTLAPALFEDGHTVIRLDPLRDHARTMREAGVDADVVNWVFTFEALVIFRDAEPTTLSAPPDPAWFQ